MDLKEEDRLKTLDLLTKIRALPASRDIDWAQHPGLGAMCDDKWGLHLHGPDNWERSIASFDEEKTQTFRRDYDAIERAESELLMRGFDTVWSEQNAYKVFDLTF